jgi:hypothetical protein
VLQHDPRAAARERDLGLRKIGRLTWRAGLAGAVCSAGLALAFGHHPAQATTSPGGGTSSSIPASSGASGGTTSSSPASSGTSGGSSTQNGQNGGSISIPSQAPQPASGPSHATSGGTSAHVP